MAEQPPKEDEKSKAKGWHFLTANDRALLLTPPQAPPGPGRRAVLPSKRAAKERKKLQDRYNKTRREAKLHFRGALEDLVFLAELMDREWLWDVLTQTRRLNEAQNRGIFAAVPPTFTPLEQFLHALIQKVGWAPFPPTVMALPNPERDTTTGFTRPGTPTPTEQAWARGELYVERLTTALEAGLHATGRPEARIDVRLRAVPDLAEAWKTKPPPSSLTFRRSRRST